MVHETLTHISPRHAAKQLKTQTLECSEDAKLSPLPPLNEGETVLAAVADGSVSVTLREGGLHVDSPSPVQRQITLLTATPTRQAVKRAALGAEGLVLDHYSEAALQAHLEAVDETLLEAAGAARVRAVFTDSLEVYAGNWTDDLLAEFERRRGYDLTGFLPMLLESLMRHEAGSAVEASTPDRQRLVRDVQHDYALTLTELLDDHFLRPVQRFAHERGVLSRVQAYGVPPATLSSYRHVDIPEGETTLGVSDIQQPAEWTEITPNRFAASASRFKARGLVSGETWTRLHSPPYAATPLDMKAEADQFFLQGVNQIVGHGWCHRPHGGDPTQWVFYAAGNFNEANPWRPVLPDLTHYLQTISSLLRVGEPVVDVAIYLPDHDVWASRTLSPLKANLHHVNALREHIGTSLPEALLELGYNFDLVDDAALQTLPDDESTRYRVVLLPRVERIPRATLEALRRLAERLVVVILGKVPDQPPGFAERTQDGDEIQRLGRALFTPGTTTNVHRIDETNMAALKQWCVPDVALDQDTPAVGYVHRRLDRHDLYFFANTTNQTIRSSLRLREPRRYAYRLDPATHEARSTNTSCLTLEAFESAVLLLTDAELSAGDFADFHLRTDESHLPVNTQDISENWELIVPGHPPFKIDRPRLWTDWPAFHNHAGEATYSKIFDSPPDWIDRDVFLELDAATPITPRRLDPERRNTGALAFLDTPVKDACEVLLNGQRVAALLTPPYRIDITGLIHAGENLLQIKVYNRLTNTLANSSRYDFSRVHEAFGQRFDAIQDFDAMQVEPAGLSGSVQLHVAD